jgi:hypothetical protein
LFHIEISEYFPAKLKRSNFHLPSVLKLIIIFLFGYPLLCCRIIQPKAIFGRKKAGAEYPLDSSATRLSTGDPVGFPSHPCGRFSIIVYLALVLVLSGLCFRFRASRPMTPYH